MKSTVFLFLFYHFCPFTLFILLFFLSTYKYEIIAETQTAVHLSPHPLRLSALTGRRSTCPVVCQRWTGCWASATSSMAPRPTWWRASASTTSTHESAANTQPCLARAPTLPARLSTPTTSPSAHPKESTACSWPKFSLAGVCWLLLIFYMHLNYKKSHPLYMIQYMQIY